MSMFFEFKGKSERELAGLQEERRFLPPFRRKKFQIKQRWLAKAGHLCRRSFFHKVFPHIQCAGKQDDSALDEVLQILRHTHHGQTHEDQAQHHNADNDTSDLTDAAHEGHAADDAGRDGVQLIVQAGVGRVGADTCALDEAGKTIHSAGQGENAHMFLPKVVLFQTNHMTAVSTMANST